MALLPEYLPPNEDGTINPIYTSELARLHWPRTIREHYAYGSIVCAVVLCAASSWWCQSKLSPSSFTLWEDIPFIAVVFASLAVALVSSVGTALLTVTFVQRQIASGRWGDLRATPQSANEIVKAYDSIAQIRAWRLNIIEVALRIAAGILAILNRYYSAVLYRGLALDLTILTDCLTYVFIIGIVALFVLGTLWRMRTIIALSIAFTLHFKNMANSLTSALAATFLIHLLQIGIIIGLWFGAESYFARTDFIGPIEVLCVLPGSLLGIIFGFAYLYKSLRVKALEFATNRVG